MPTTTAAITSTASQRPGDASRFMRRCSPATERPSPSGTRRRSRHPIDGARRGGGRGGALALCREIPVAVVRDCGGGGTALLTHTVLARVRREVVDEPLAL